MQRVKRGKAEPPSRLPTRPDQQMMGSWTYKTGSELLARRRGFGSRRFLIEPPATGQHAHGQRRVSVPDLAAGFRPPGRPARR